jgi:hypothetical protein|tara:strand:- start:2035 stop:2517 length:483 start_codon:yes stop_codon:yes gene_type:complete
MQQKAVKEHSPVNIKAHISAVLPEHLPVVWDDIKFLIHRACKRSNGRHTMETVYEQIVKQQQQLWIIISEDTEKIIACATTQIMSYPTGLNMLEVVLLGGSQKEDWLIEGWDILEKFARANNCSGLQAIGRKGLRYLTVKIDKDWEEKAYLFEKKFKEYK